MKGIHAVGTIRANCIINCPMLSNKEIQKTGWGALIYRSDSNSGLTVAKCVDNKIVQLCSNYAGINPMSTIQRWDKTEKSPVPIQCLPIVTMHNKSMGGVDLVDMLIALYRINVKTKRWYIKLFCYLVDICKVNASNMYWRLYSQLVLPSNRMLTLCQFSNELVKVLMHVNKASTLNQRGKPSKQQSSRQYQCTI